jgi:hypothetical protein
VIVEGKPGTWWSKRRLALAAVSGLALLLVAPLLIGELYATRQLACFEGLAQADAPRAAFDERFDPTSTSTYSSGDIRYSYHLAYRISGMIIVRRGEVRNFGTDVPDYGNPLRDTVGLYRNTGELFRHPWRFLKSCL